MENEEKLSISVIFFIIMSIPHLYSAFFHATHVQKGLTYSVASTRAYVHPLSVQMQRNLTRGTD